MASKDCSRDLDLLLTFSWGITPSNLVSVDWSGVISSVSFLKSLLQESSYFVKLSKLQLGNRYALCDNLEQQEFYEMSTLSIRIPVGLSFYSISGAIKFALKSVASFLLYDWWSDKD